jgi:hypothetical protein
MWREREREREREEGGEESRKGENGTDDIVLLHLILVPAKKKREKKKPITQNTHTHPPKSHHRL